MTADREVARLVAELQDLAVKRFGLEVEMHDALGRLRSLGAPFDDVAAMIESAVPHVAALDP